MGVAFHQGTAPFSKVTEAIGRGIEEGGNIGFQRGMINQGLDKLTNLPSNANAFDLTKALIQATAGIPGAERYLPTLFPALLARMRGQQTGLNAGQPGQPNVAGEQNAPQGAGEIGAGGQFERKGGYLTPPLNAEEANAFAQNYSLGDPTKLAEGYQIAEQQNKMAEKAYGNIQSSLAGLGVKANELPYAMQMAQQSSEKNPEKLITQTMRNLEEVRALDNALVPGKFRAVAKTGVLGLIPALLAGGTKREEALKGLQPTVESLKSKGFEPIVRDKLAALGLSRTEVEERIHPFTKEMESKISNFPKASSNPQKNENILENFITKNLKPDMSLLALRHKLWKERGYDWQQVRDALEKARDKGFPLSKSQQIELTEFGTQPPRDSLIDIFKDWGRPFDVLQGRK